MALNRWGFPQPVGLITRTDQIIQSLSKVTVDTSSIESIVDTSVSTAVNNITEKIDNAKTEVIDSIPECECSQITDCCIATKCDIKNAVTEIKEHIDNTFNGINQTELFTEISEIYNKL